MKTAGGSIRSCSSLPVNLIETLEAYSGETLFTFRRGRNACEDTLHFDWSVCCSVCEGVDAICDLTQVRKARRADAGHRQSEEPGASSISSHDPGNEVARLLMS